MLVRQSAKGCVCASSNSIPRSVKYIIAASLRRRVHTDRPLLSEATVVAESCNEQIPGFTEEEVKNALNAMVSNKDQSATAAVAAVASSDGDDDKAFG